MPAKLSNAINRNETVDCQMFERPYINQIIYLPNSAFFSYKNCDFSQFL